MGVSREIPPSLLVAACFSRHTDALQWATSQLSVRYGPIALTSADFPFHHTKYYEPTMGPDLVKRLVVFQELASADSLPEAKKHAIALERDLIAQQKYPEERPLNVDPGLLQLGKFLLATTKDQSHRIYLRDGIFAEVTLRFTAGEFEVWPWTYADYREPAVRSFLNEARTYLYRRVTTLRATS